jgi:acid phosphatase (class B)
MRKITLALSAACLLFSLNSAVVARASAPTPLYTGTTAAILAEQAPIHWVSVAQIENSLMGARQWPWALTLTIPCCSQARLLARQKNVFTGQRSVSEEPGVLGKNE